MKGTLTCCLLASKQTNFLSLVRKKVILLLTINIEEKVENTKWFATLFFYKTKASFS